MFKSLYYVTTKESVNSFREPSGAAFVNEKTKKFNKDYEGVCFITCYAALENHICVYCETKSYKVRRKMIKYLKKFFEYIEVESKNISHREPITSTPSYLYNAMDYGFMDWPKN